MQNEFTTETIPIKLQLNPGSEEKKEDSKVGLIVLGIVLGIVLLVVIAFFVKKS